MQHKSSAVIADLLLFGVFFFLVWGLDSGLGEMIRFGDGMDFSQQIAGARGHFLGNWRLMKYP